MNKLDIFNQAIEIIEGKMNESNIVLKTYKACKKLKKRHQEPFDVEEKMFGLTLYLALATFRILFVS